MNFLRKNFLLILSIIFLLLGKKLIAGESLPEETAPEDDNAPTTNDNEGDTTTPEDIPEYPNTEEPVNLPPWETDPPITDEDIWDDYGDGDTWA